jgi:peptidyl-tRNA hydrolase
MAQLQFEISKLDSRFASGGDGEAFQLFVFELLEPELPHLHPYPAGGKDGGIDHLTNAPGQPRTVVECKFCGTDGFEVVRKRWRVTEGNLAKNLEPADEPAQSQYAPWYRTDEPITHYIFTTSARLENPARSDELRDLIRDFFHALAVKYVHLAHLSTLVVEVRDWNFIEPRVPAILRFRWFPGERPAGLRLLASEDEAAQGFRAWLRSSKLPFYSRAEHLAIEPAPSGGDLPDEKALLGILGADQGTLGLILVGQGGVGKTRLALEIGQTAVADGWTVWVVHRRLKTEALDQLAARMDENSRVLLVFDYVETHPEFANVVQHLADIVDDTGHHIRYVATCRSSYYRAIKGVDRQREVKLSMAKPAAEAWLMSYRRATVRHILDHADISLDERNIAACHDLPVLAAFLHWLHYGGRTEELQSLLGEEAFGKWVINRVKLSFPGRDLDHSLARLIALFPIPALGRSALTDDERDLFYRLEQDGWIEKADDPSAGETAWQTAHDVMADQVALEWLKSIGSAAQEWCSELLREAIRFHALPSALRSLQRLAEHLPIGGDEWEKLLLNEAQREPQAWRTLRSALLRTSLLPAVARVRLLVGLSDVFSGAEVDGEFQSALGDVLRQLVETKTGSELIEDERAALFAWVRRTIPFQRNLPYLRAWAVRFAPEVFSGETLTYIVSRADKPATQYVLCAWIYAGLLSDSIEIPMKTWCEFNSNKVWFSFVAEAWLGGHGNPSVIQPFIGAWIQRFSPTLQPSFVFKAWLDAGADKALLQEPLLEWLEQHRCDFESSHAYKAWLDAGGDKAAVRVLLREWLNIHKANASVDFVCKAWLDAGGDKEVVQEPLLAWLGEHRTEFEAEFVYKSWLDAGGDKALVQDALLAWLVEHGTEVDAQFVYQPWLDAGGDKALVQDALLAWLGEHKANTKAEFIYQSWLDAGGDKGVVQEPLLAWLGEHRTDVDAGFVYKSWLDAGGDKALVQVALLAWLGENGTSLDASHVLAAWLESKGALEFVDGYVRDWLSRYAETFEDGSYVLRTWLRAGGDSAFGISFVLDWLSIHGEELDAQFVLAAWLKSKNNPHPLKASVTKWLLHHGTTSQASHVIGPWLDAGGEYLVVSQSAIPWAKKYGTEFEACYVLAACLKINAARSAFEQPAVNWLEQHAATHPAAFIFTAWIKAGLKAARISSFVGQWLKAHASRNGSSHVICAWIDAKGPLDVVREGMLRWLAARRPGDNTSWVLVSWLRAGGARDVVAEYVESYLANGANPRSVFALRNTWANETRQSPPFRRNRWN